MEKQLKQLVAELRKYYNRTGNNQLLKIHLNGPLSLLGYIHLQKREFGKAEELLHEALDSLEGTPQKFLLHPYIHELLVQVYLKQGKMTDARKFSKEAFELSAIKEGIDKRLFLKLYPAFDGLI
jgi:tetratricopeptide (TPR) repeat protein